jgi:D-amino peptidase
MTRLLIIADMEGITGIGRYEACVRGHPEYPAGVRLLAEEVNVAIDAALSSGATSVSVIDWHAGGGNLTPEMLDERGKLVAEDLAPGYDLAFFLGAHAMAGDHTGFVTHTMRRGLAVEYMDRPVGESVLISRWLGENGVPLGLVTGDAAVTIEVERMLPDTPSHTVKRATSWSRAESVSLEQSYAALRLRIARIFEQRGRWVVYEPQRPVGFRLRPRTAQALVARIPWLERQEDGWWAGAVERMRDLIDLIDLVAALISLGERNALLARLSDDPDAVKLVHEALLDTVDHTIRTNPWP